MGKPKWDERELAGRDPKDIERAISWRAQTAPSIMLGNEPKLRPIPEVVTPIPPANAEEIAQPDLRPLMSMMAQQQYAPSAALPMMSAPVMPQPQPVEPLLPPSPTQIETPEEIMRRQWAMQMGYY